MDYNIPNEPIIFPEIDINNHNPSLSIPTKQIFSEKDNNNKLTISKELQNIQKEENINEKMTKNTFLSKKTKEKEEKKEKNKNNKFKDNNIRRKCKRILLDIILSFINEKIKEFYNNNIGKGIFKKELQNLNQTQTSESNVKFNQDFLNKTLKDIFSEDICRKINNFPPEHNKNLVEKLLNEKDIIIKDYFTNLFNLTFFQCLEHYRGTNFYNELNQMKLFKNEINNYTNGDEEYTRLLEHYIQNYETIINNKRPRKNNKNNAK